MKKILIVFISLLFISNCSLNKVVKVHGVNYLDKKQEKLTINTSNKNDIIKLLGPPSTSGTFDKDLWIYIERRTSSSKLSKLGKKKLLVNNVLILELSSQGLLVSKVFLDKEKMQDLDFIEDLTKISHTKKSFLRNFLAGLRNKIDDPLGKKRRKKKTD